MPMLLLSSASTIAVVRMVAVELSRVRRDVAMKFARSVSVILIHLVARTNGQNCVV